MEIEDEFHVPAEGFERFVFGGDACDCDVLDSGFGDEATAAGEEVVVEPAVGLRLGKFVPAVGGRTGVSGEIGKNFLRAAQRPPVRPRRERRALE